MTPVNIALCGKFRSGKDAVAAFLTENYGYTRFAFGDELKRYAHELFDVPDGEKPRELYQWFGQTMRQRDPAIWTRLLFDRIMYEYGMREEFKTESSFHAVLSDLRQPNEFSALRERGYTIIRVMCPDDLRIQRALAAGDVFDAATLSHDTESHIDGFAVDYEIVNDGTLDELYAKVDAVIVELTKLSEVAE
jgi:dephospho-CoA kinase